jgi:hypothetical protein
MNKMTLKLYGTDGAELGAVQFDTDHVTWALRTAGYQGRITEGKLAQYIGELVYKSGQSWDQQKVEHIKRRVAELYQPGADMAQLNQQVNQDLAQFLSWEPRAGYDDAGNPLPSQPAPPPEN